MWIDVAAIAFLALFGVLGYFRGLFSQAWSLGALVVSFFTAEPALQYLHSRLGTGREEAWLGEWILTLAVGAVIYVALLAVGYLLEKSVIERFKLLAFGNRFLGFSLGLVKGVLGAVIAVWLLSFLAPVWGAADSLKERQAAAKGSETAMQPGTSTLQAQLEASRVAALVNPYNPLNLLLLAKVKPYLPPALTGSSRPAVKPPSAVERNETYQSLLADVGFLEAYRNRNYLEMIRNPAFHRFVQDKNLLDALEESKH